MNKGIGTLNYIARNMTRGPRGIGAYQQFENGGPVYMSNGGAPNFELLRRAVQQVESNNDPMAVSEDGAIGLMQILPSTAAQPGYKQYGTENVFDIAERLIGFKGERNLENARSLLFDPEVNVEFGTKYLKAMLEDSGGDVKQALQKYNAGVGNYQSFKEDPVKNPLDQEAVQYPIKVSAALQGYDLNNPVEMQSYLDSPEAGGVIMAAYEEPSPRPKLRPDGRSAPISPSFPGLKSSIRPQLRPEEEGIASLPELSEDKLSEGELIRKKFFEPKEGTEEPYRQPQKEGTYLDRIQEFLDLDRIQEFFENIQKRFRPNTSMQIKKEPKQRFFQINTYDGRPAIDFADGQTMRESEIIEMFDKFDSAPEPLLGEKTRQEMSDYFLENPASTKDSFIKYFSSKRLAKGGIVSLAA